MTAPAKSTVAHSVARQARGFTLIELMLVVGLIGILAAMGGHFGSIWRKDHRLNETSRAYFSALSYARSQAIKRGRTVVTNFSKQAIRVFIDTDGDNLYTQADTSLGTEKSGFVSVGDGQRGSLPVPEAILATAVTADHQLNDTVAVLFDYQGFCLNPSQTHAQVRVRIKDLEVPKVTYDVDVTVAGAVRVTRTNLP